MTEYAFTVRGDPKPQPRPKARMVTPRGGKPFVSIYTPTTGCEEWRKAVRKAAALAFQFPRPGSLEVEITVYAPRPQRLCRARDFEGVIRADTAIGDVDNYAKAILDAMKGVAFEDDAQVTDLVARKRYTAKGAAPGARVVVREVERVPVMFDV